MTMMNEPLYQKIYDYIFEKIENKELSPGDRVYSEAELAIKFGVSRITSKKALEMLAARGVINRIAGKGSFVAEEAEIKLSMDSSDKPQKQIARIIGFITTDFTDTYGTGLVSGIEKYASKHGYSVVIKRTYGDIKVEEQAIQSLIELGVDGIIIMPVQGEYYSDAILKLYLEGYPIVFLDRYLKGLPIPYVTSDNFNAARNLTNFLFDCGHKNIALLSIPIANTTTLEERYNGFIQSHVDHEVVPDQSIWLTDITCVLPNMFNEENRLKDMQKIIKLVQDNPQINAIFACEYAIAYIAAIALKSIGIRIPEEFKIVCFDGPHISFSDFYFTYARQNEEAMGEEAVKILMNLLEGEENFERKVIIDVDLEMNKAKNTLY